MIREFREKDVNRMRNLILGKSGEKTQSSVGFESQNIEYSEGDVWEDHYGKKWTIKNGIKQTVTKNDELKKLVILPLSCPKCKKPLKTDHINKKMYSIHQTCFDCVIELETQLKSQGKWNDYENKQLSSNIKTSLEDFEAAIDTWYNDKDTHVSENGDIENWSGGDKSKIYQEIKDNLKKIKSEDIYK